MLYSVAVDGRMPFVDHKSYREQQIKKVIQKHRAKRQRDCLIEQTRREASLHSADANGLHPALYRVSHNICAASSNLDSDSEQDEKLKITKRSILHAIKRWFTAGARPAVNSDSDSSLSRSVYQPRFQSKSSRNRAQSAPIDILQSRKTALNSNSPPGVSPKRQRRRTVSNIGSIMETIEEIPENFVLKDEVDTDTSSDSASNTSSSTDSLNMRSLDSSLDSLLHEVSGHASWASTSATSSIQDLSRSNSTCTGLLACSI